MDRPAESVSRRSVLGATMAVPIGEATMLPSPVVLDCSQWLAINQEIERLTLRWATLDAHLLGRNSGANTLNRLGVSDALLAMEADLDLLYDRRQRLFVSIAKHPASSVTQVAAKLAVAAHELEGEGGPVFEIVSEAATFLAR